jgi:hypothetical protein
MTTVKVSRDLLKAAVEYLSEDLGCDHSVGICMCDLVGVVQELNLALDGKATCTACAGDGFLFLHNDFDNQYNCPACNGKGVVPA